MFGRGDWKLAVGKVTRVLCCCCARVPVFTHPHGLLPVSIFRQYLGRSLEQRLDGKCNATIEAQTPLYVSGPWSQPLHYLAGAFMTQDVSA